MRHNLRINCLNLFRRVIQIVQLEHYHLLYRDKVLNCSRGNVRGHITIVLHAFM